MKTNQTAELLLDTLRKKKYTITFAESCTGGLMSSSFVDASGASSVFEYGFVTYSKESKNETLGVSFETIDNFGIVSKEVALEMAKGAIAKSRADVAISVTGCAGPGKDDEGNEAGTVCFGFIIKDIILSEKTHINGTTRNEIRENAVEYAFQRIIYFLNNTD